MVKHIIKIFFIALIFLSVGSKIPAQSEPIKPDNVQTDTTKFEMEKSAWGAVLRSAIIPGFGQFYNESYWKIPVVWGALGYLSYLWIDSNKNYKIYRDLFAANQSNSSYLSLREFYKDQRDLNAVFIGLAYFLNLVDAYVDAHLFDFNVSEEMQVSTYYLSLKIRF
ncbi:MAG: DUF5683 domain-containing protein [Melioribacteraceae bacterium]|nr:DUF5683 domain-containing protein [Melioribacteraceae bacterium]